MPGAIRIWAAAFIAALAITQVRAQDLGPLAELLPHDPPNFYGHVGALGVFPQLRGGFFGVPGFTERSNVSIRPQITLGLEAGVFVTPNIAIAFSTNVPPIAHIKATGLLGTDLLGSVRFGPAIFLLQYHFTQFGAFQPYFGAGPAYVLNFGNISDGILENFKVDQNFAFVVQAGADVMLGALGLPNWGIFLDGKRVFFSTDAFGFALGAPNIPIRTHVHLDSWLATAGITFKY